MVLCCIATYGEIELFCVNVRKFCPVSKFFGFKWKWRGSKFEKKQPSQLNNQTKMNVVPDREQCYLGLPWQEGLKNTKAAKAIKSTYVDYENRKRKKNLL